MYGGFIRVMVVERLKKPRTSERLDKLAPPSHRHVTVTGVRDQCARCCDALLRPLSLALLSMLLFVVLSAVSLLRVPPL